MCERTDIHTLGLWLCLGWKAQDNEFVVSLEGGREGGRLGRDGGREVGEGGREGGMTITHIPIGMFNSNSMTPQGQQT